MNSMISFNPNQEETRQMNPHDKEYHDLLIRIGRYGFDKGDRTGTGTRSLFGERCVFDLAYGFPLITTKQVHYPAIIHELLWILTGDTNIKYLQDNDVHIWDEWADADGNLGPVYGHQWRDWGGDGVFNQGIDQLANVIEIIKTNPNDRRMIVTAWNPTEVEAAALPPCHCLFQFNVQGDRLHLQMYQRSCDVFLGVPFNIASYALLLTMIAQVTGLKPGVFTHIYGDVHIYNNHKKQVQEQLKRQGHMAPRLELNPDIKNIDDFTFEDIEIVNYTSDPAIKAPVSV